jgi:trimethylamine--corrinoid protein Co-methyltransferase
MEEVRRSRASTKEDVAMMALICDYLPSVSFYWPSVCAQDVDPEVLALHELEAAIINTEKHTHIINCTDGKTAAYAVEMAKVISGGSEVMRKRPPFSLYMATFSPLSQNEGLIDAALVFSEAGLPLVIGTTPIAGLSAPGSLMGAMLLGNAEILSMVCLTQLVNPGAPVCYAFFYAVMNPITAGEWATGPQKSAFQAGVNQLGHYYNLPVMCCSGSNDDNEPGGWLAGKEYTVDAFSAALTGAELVSSMGLLENYTLLYPEKIIFDNEIFYSVKALSEGIQTDSDTASVAIKEIIEVGHEGHFLDRDYTRENIRKLWQQEIRNEISNIIASAERELVK